MDKIQLRVLGDVELRSGSGDLVGSVLNQPRRLALLVYLALETNGGGVQRDRLLGLFWPDLAQDQARQSLRTALHFLRRSLGTAVLTGDGTAVGVDPDVLCCDAAAFRTLLADDPAAALQLYRGDLLPGFYLDDGPPEFEHWLEEARGSLRREAAHAAWALALEQESAGNAAGAGAWARRAAHLFEQDEAAVRQSMELLVRVGDRAGALATYEELARRLADEFGAEPCASTQAAIAAARGDARAPEPEPAGGPAAAAVASADHPMEQDPGATRPAVAGQPPPARPAGGWREVARRLSRGAYSAGVTLVLMISFYSLWGLSRGESTAVAKGPVAPVLQVETMRDFSGDEGGVDLAGAITLEITSRLSGVGSLQVVPLGQERRADREASPTYIVRGGLLQADSVVRVTAMLLDGESGATLQRITAERSVRASGSTAELADVLARGIRREIGRVVEDRERSATSRNPRALALVRSAVRDVAAADSLGRKGAIEAAQLSFAAADSQLALAHRAAPRWSEPSVRRAELAYRRMWLHLAPPAVDVATAGQVLAGGVAHADAALAVAADDPAALEVRGLLDYWRWRLRAAGSEAENEASRRRAEADLTRATELDASRARAWSILSTLHDARGDYAAANLAARRAHDADPYLENATDILLRLFSTSLEIGDPAAARRWCDELGRLDQSWVSAYCSLEQMAWTGAPSGMDADALRALIDQTRTDSPGAAHARARFEMVGAVILAGAGFDAAALAAIERANQAPGAATAHVLVLEAWARLTLGDDDDAVDLLARAAAADARLMRSRLPSRRFEALRADGRLAGLLPDG